MCRFAVIRLAALALLAAFATAALAASADDFKAAFAKAEAAEQSRRRAQEPMDHDRGRLKAAQAAASAGNYDEAVKTRKRGRSAGQRLDRPGQRAGDGRGQTAVIR